LRAALDPDRHITKLVETLRRFIAPAEMSDRGG
jgi:hypothetical protein